MAVMVAAPSKVSAIEKKMLIARIGKLESLPLPSYSMLEFSTRLKAVPPDMSNILDSIIHDHALLAQVFRIYYSLYPDTEPESPLSALESIPQEQLKTLAYVPHILEQFGETEEKEWNHSYSVRLLMESILSENGISDPALVRAAHLHDIGKNVFRDWSPKKYRLVENQTESSNNIAIHKMETAILQINHAEVGSLLLKNWGFPEKIWSIIELHHTDNIPADFPYIFELALLQFTNWVDCKARGIECEQPSKITMQRAGIEEIDGEAYVQLQKRLIEELANTNAGSIRKNALDNLLASENIVRAVDIAAEEQAKAEAAAQAEKEATEKKEAEKQAEAEEEPESTFDPDSYVISTIPSAMAKREAELMERLKKK